TPTDAYSRCGSKQRYDPSNWSRHQRIRQESRRLEPSENLEPRCMESREHSVPSLSTVRRQKSAREPGTKEKQPRKSVSLETSIWTGSCEVYQTLPTYELECHTVCP